LQKGEDVLVHAGASGVGLAAIQLAKSMGANKVYITAGSEEKIKFCESVGAEKGINYKASDWAEEVGPEGREREREESRLNADLLRHYSTFRSSPN
jgi:NADPH:quinone reductase-like Zn-dependent oxidoreductase